MSENADSQTMFAWISQLIWGVAFPLLIPSFAKFGAALVITFVETRRPMSKEKLQSVGHRVFVAIAILVGLFPLFREAWSVYTDPDPFNRGAGVYRILGVSANADSKIISKRNRELSRELHPDKNPSLEGALAYKLVSEANEILRNENTRSVHDRFGYKSAAAWAVQDNITTADLVVNYLIQNMVPYYGLTLLVAVLPRIFWSARHAWLTRVVVTVAFLAIEYRIVVGSPRETSFILLSRFLPAFQVVRILRASQSGILSVATLLVRDPVDPVYEQLGQLTNTVTSMSKMADGAYHEISSPFRQDKAALEEIVGSTLQELNQYAWLEQNPRAKKNFMGFLMGNLQSTPTAAKADPKTTAIESPSEGQEKNTSTGIDHQSAGRLDRR